MAHKYTHLSFMHTIWPIISTVFTASYALCTINQCVIYMVHSNTNNVSSYWYMLRWLSTSYVSYCWYIISLFFSYLLFLCVINMAHITIHRVPLYWRIYHYPVCQYIGTYDAYSVTYYSCCITYGHIFPCYSPTLHRNYSVFVRSLFLVFLYFPCFSVL